MSTSVYFNNFAQSQEQLLIENLIIESIRIYGHDLYYCPRDIINKDEIYGEDNISEYNTNYFVEMYIKNVEGFEGEGDFLSKFNLQIRDQITFTVARRVFHDEVGATALLDRPQEGDLIFFPLNKKIFVVKFVEHESIFYQMGALQIWDLVCELFEYSNEQLNTGIAEIDELQNKFSLNLSDYGLLTETKVAIQDENGYDLVLESYDIDTAAGDSYADNDEIQEISDTFTDFSVRDPFSESGEY
jgi:hypothetical protein